MVHARYRLPEYLRLLEIVGQGLAGPPYDEEANATVTYTIRNARKSPFWVAVRI